MDNLKVSSINILKIGKGLKEEQPDLLAVEEPLEIRLGYSIKNERVQKSLAVTMRTPGNDFELVVGFLFSEGIIRNYEEIEHIHYCKTVKPEEEGNVVRVALKSSVNIDWEKLQRHFYTSSSCGVCGKSSIDSLAQSCLPVTRETLVGKNIIYGLPDKLYGNQPVFNYTGGLHAAGIFTKDGYSLKVREDVGRHNALDKLIGSMLMEKINNGEILMLSGRISFELVQKASLAGIPIVVAVGAPSSLAVDLARQMNLTLIGFTRADRFNIYSGKQRIQL